MMRFIPFFLLILSAACATHDSELQTARLVEVGSNTYTFAYQYLAEHDEDVWNKRKRYHFSEDYNASSIASGANFLMRRGLTSFSDIALNLSVGSSSLETRFGLFNGERFASALGLKIVLPTFAIEVPTLYRYKIVWYNSVELLPTLALYVAPHIEWKPFGNLKKEYRGISAGMVIGKDSGIVVEASFARAQRGDDPTSYEQFSIGYTTGLDKLRGRLAYDRRAAYIKILPSFGLRVFPTPSLGLIVRYLDKALDYEFGVDFGIGPIPNLSETKVGLMTSRVFALRARHSFADSHFVKFGLTRKEVRANFAFDMSWHHLAVINHGLEFFWEQSFGQWHFAWIGVYLPLLVLPHSHSYSAGDYEWRPSEEFEDLTKKWEKQLSFSLLNIHKEL